MKRLIERGILFDALNRVNATPTQRAAVYRLWEERGLIAALALAAEEGRLKALGCDIRGRQIR